MVMFLSGILSIYLLLIRLAAISTCQSQAVDERLSWLEFSSLTTIEESLDRVAETSSSEYPTLLFSKGFELVLSMSSCIIPFMNASCISALSIAFTGIHIWLTWVNWPSRRLILRRTTLILLFWSRRGITMNDMLKFGCQFEEQDYQDQLKYVQMNMIGDGYAMYWFKLIEIHSTWFWYLYT